MSKRCQTWVVGLACGWMLVVMSGATGCAEDGCDNVRGKYRLNATLSAKADGTPCAATLESIVDPQSSTDGNGCATRLKTTEGTSSCKQETTGTCADGRSYTDVMSCEDDGQSCRGTIQLSFADGGGCIYDYTATRL